MTRSCLMHTNSSKCVPRSSPPRAPPDDDAEEVAYFADDDEEEAGEELALTQGAEEERTHDRSEMIVDDDDERRHVSHFVDNDDEPVPIVDETPSSLSTSSTVVDGAAAAVEEGEEALCALLLPAHVDDDATAPWMTHAPAESKPRGPITLRDRSKCTVIRSGDLPPLLRDERSDMCRGILHNRTVRGDDGCPKRDLDGNLLYERVTQSTPRVHTEEAVWETSLRRPKEKKVSMWMTVPDAYLGAVLQRAFELDGARLGTRGALWAWLRWVVVEGDDAVRWWYESLERAHVSPTEWRKGRVGGVAAHKRSLRGMRTPRATRALPKKVVLA